MCSIIPKEIQNSVLVPNLVPEWPVEDGPI